MLTLASPTEKATEKATDIQAHSLSLLNSRQLQLLQPDFKNHDWFSNVYQSRSQKKHPEYYSLKTLLQAVHNSESEFKQFPVDERNLKNIARSIFTEYIWLQRDVTLAVVEGHFYVVGGRHRTNAIANVFAQVIRDRYSTIAWSDEDRQQAFDLALEQNIRCEVLYLNSLEDLLILITVDNDSRTMRKAETSHLMAQAYGADASSIGSISRAVLGHDLSPTEAVAIAAQNFVRRPSVLKPQTLQVIGQKVAKHVLYGTRADKKLSTKNEVQVTSLEELEAMMDKAWKLLEEIIEGKAVIAKDSTAIAKQIIEKLGDSPKDARTVVSEPALTVAKPDLDPEEAMKPAKVARKTKPVS